MPRNDIFIEDAHLIFKNFQGRGGMYNAEGDRNFAIDLTDRPELAEQLAEAGLNVKLRKPFEGDEDDRPKPYLAVKVNFKGPRPPTIKMIGLSTGKTTELDEESVETLDFVDVDTVDLIISPYNWEFGGRSGISAYLSSLYANVIENPLDLKYGNTAIIATVDGPMMERTEMLIPPPVDE